MNGEIFFLASKRFRLLYTIFFLTKSAKKVRLLFLRGLQARRGFFGRSGLKFEVSSLSREGSRLPASFLGGLMASLARAPAGPTHALCLTFPAPFTPSGGALYFFCGAKKNNIKWRRRRKKIGVRCKNLAFYTTESLNEPFFAEQKRKNGAAGKNFLGTACMVRDSWCGQQPSSPKNAKNFFSKSANFFFFFQN